MRLNIPALCVSLVGITLSSFILFSPNLDLPGQDSYLAPTLPARMQMPRDLLEGKIIGYVRIGASLEHATNLPTRLIIPKIQVDAPLEYVGLTSQGAMDMPKDPQDAGWFNLGPRPGERGSAVIAGHYGFQNGKPSVFDDLYKLRKGDAVSITDDTGKTTSFVVREIRRYNPTADAADVFGSRDEGAHLNLITCEGLWNNASQGYPKRLIIFTDKITDELSHE